MIQPKLKIGQPGDKYEREADEVADRVIRMSDAGNWQMQADVNAPQISMKCAHCEEEDQLQMQPMEEEEEIQMKPTVQKLSDGNPYTTADISQRLQNKKGMGEYMPGKVNKEMGSKIGADFGNTKIHTDSNAILMNQELGAQAFTHGNDIYFNQGKYNPESSAGKHLLAHELVHTIHQDGASMLRRKKKKKTPKKDVKIHDYFHKGDSACACLIHIHNDERNSKAVARLLNDKCNYNLVDIKDSKASARGLNKSLKILNEKGRKANKTDPNEIFSQKIIESCFDPVEKKKLKKKGYAVDEICSLFKDIAKCSNSFTLPVVALHNNTELPNKKDKKAATKESTNIYRWALSKAIKKTLIEDQKNPDRVVWTSNPKDFEKLKKAGGVNTALADEKFTGDTDLSTMFNFLPESAVKLGSDVIKSIAKTLRIDPDVLTEFFKKEITSQLRYINIETEHKRNVYDQSLAEVNLEFVHKVLSNLGLWCCDKSMTPKNLKKELKEIKRK